MAETLITGDRHYVPSATSSNERFRFYPEAGTGKLTVQITRDGGNTWTAIASEPPSNAGVGWIPTLSENGSIKWISPGAAFRSTRSSSGAQTWIDFSFPGETQSNTTFGAFEVPSNTTIVATGIQLSVFSAPVTPVSVSIVSYTSGTELLGIDPTFIGASQFFVATNFSTPVQINAGTRISAKVNLNLSQESLGSYLVARLIVRSV